MGLQGDRKEQGTGARAALVVGASAAGLATATALCRSGAAGRVTLLGDERHAPYDRPPLSKQVLAGDWDPQRAQLPGVDALAASGAELILGDRAVALDVAGRTVTTASGATLAADDIVIATGLTPRWLPGTAGLGGVHVIRTLEDCLGLQADLRTARRVVVVGEGVLGCEVAATARKLGHDVTLVGLLHNLMERQIGPLAGSALGALHAGHGVTLRLGANVAGLTEESGRVTGVALRTPDGGGETLDADVVVVAIGASPATGWLEGSGLTLDNGVVCDSRCRAAAGIWAAGDVARFHHEGLGELVRLENRTNAGQQALAVAENIGGADRPYTPVPYFWTDQYDARLQVHGTIGPDRPVRIVDGDPAQGRFVALYGSPGDHPVTTGVLGWNMPKATRLLRQQILDATPWADATPPVG